MAGRQAGRRAGGRKLTAVCAVCGRRRGIADVHAIGRTGPDVIACRDAEACTRRVWEHGGSVWARLARAAGAEASAAGVASTAGVHTPERTAYVRTRRKAAGTGTGTASVRAGRRRDRIGASVRRRRREERRRRHERGSAGVAVLAGVAAALALVLAIAGGRTLAGGQAGGGRTGAGEAGAGAQERARSGAGEAQAAQAGTGTYAPCTFEDEHVTAAGEAWACTARDDVHVEAGVVYVDCEAARVSCGTGRADLRAAAACVLGPGGADPPDPCPPM